jgi:hypothetical protein
VRRWLRGDDMEPILMSVAATALTQGVTFLYEQAGEVLVTHIDMRYRR